MKGRGSEREGERERDIKMGGEEMEGRRSRGEGGEEYRKGPSQEQQRRWACNQCQAASASVPRFLLRAYKRNAALQR